MWYRVRLRAMNGNPGVMLMRIQHAVKAEFDRGRALRDPVVEIYSDHIRDDIVLYFSEGAWELYGATGMRPEPDEKFTSFPEVEGRRRTVVLREVVGG